jgi:hypothetical protein
MEVLIVSDDELLDSDFSVLHHALGITKPEVKEPYRNHFLAGDGHHDMPAIDRLCTAGLMEEGETPSFCSDRDRAFYVTDSGKAKAIETRPKLPKMTRGQKRYRLYLSSESGQSFGEWLKDPYWDEYRARA